MMYVFKLSLCLTKIVNALLNMLQNISMLAKDIKELSP